MNRNSLFVVGLLAALGACTLIAAVAVADSAADSQSASSPEMQLPPGWTAEDMQAMMAAGTPGKMQEYLARDAGLWRGKTTMTMYPGAAPMTSECTSTVTPIMDGRYTKVEMAGEMPGMGPYSGLGLCGFDNVSQKFVSTWIDNQSTGIMVGTGELSPDGKTLTWDFNFNCPITKKPVVMREVDTIRGPGSKTMEMYGSRSQDRQRVQDDDHRAHKIVGFWYLLGGRGSRRALCPSGIGSAGALPSHFLSPLLSQGIAYELHPPFGWYPQGCVHSHVGRPARALASERPALCRLGDVSPQGFARRSKPHLRLADQRLVWADHSAVRRRRQHVAPAWNPGRRTDDYAGRHAQAARATSSFTTRRRQRANRSPRTSGTTARSTRGNSNASGISSRR